MYEGVGHVGTVMDKRFPMDVLDFVRRQPATPREPGVERQPIPAGLASPA
jgi:hypothetical protein